MITVTKKSDKTILLVDEDGNEHTIVNKELVLIEKYKYDLTKQTVRLYVPQSNLNFIFHKTAIGNIDGNNAANRTIDTTIDLLSAVFETAASAGGGGSTDITTLNKEATQLNVKTAVEKLATNSPTLVGGKIPVDGTFFQATQPVSSLGVGDVADVAATSANYTGSKSLVALKKFIASLLIDIKALLIKGRDVMANSLSVTIASDQPPIPTGVLPIVSLAVTQVAVFNGIYFTGDVSAYRALLFQLYGTFVAIIECQGSNDNTNWVAVTCTRLGTGGQVTGATSIGQYSVNVNFKYLRFRIKSFTSGAPNMVLFGSYDYTAPPAGTVSIGAIDLGGNPLSYSLISAASVNLNLIKAGSVNVNLIVLSNTTASAKFVRLYDKATAPTAADTPKYRIMVEAGKTITMSPSVGLNFALGLGIGITGASPDNDATAVALGDLILNVNYA